MYEEHRFFCLACGNEGIPMWRRKGHLHSKGHRKKLYCPHCKREVNHVECFGDEEVENFKINFENGVYKDEAEESLIACRPTSVWKEFMGT